jgi:hypothetical protein
MPDQILNQVICEVHIKWTADGQKAFSGSWTDIACFYGFMKEAEISLPKMAAQKKVVAPDGMAIPNLRG